MKTTMKRPNAEMLGKVESMLNNFVKIRTIASTLEAQVVTIYRYANHLGYKNAMISSEEMDLIVKHRAKRIKDKIQAIQLATAVEAVPADAIKQT